MSYVDLILDLTNYGGSWHTLDEQELELASQADSAIARRAAVEVLALVSRRDPVFEPEGRSVGDTAGRPQAGSLSAANTRRVCARLTPNQTVVL